MSEPRINHRRPMLSQFAFFARLVLNVALLLRGIGLAQKYLWSSLETETSIFGWLYFDAGVPESIALLADNACIWIYLLAGLATLVRRRTGEQAGGFNRFCQVAFLFCCVWELLLVAAIVYRGDAFRTWLTPATHALRVVVPLVLLLGCRSRHTNLPARLVRIAIALTFVGHGLNAWLLHPGYATFILATGNNLAGANLDQSSAEFSLRCIAVLDVLAAVGVVFVRHFAKHYRWLLAYVALWGLITAASRVTASGAFVWHETLLRASHFLGPVALMYYCCEPVRQNANSTDQPSAA